MAGESQQTPESVPDPTVLVTDAIARSEKAQRDYFDGQIKVLMAHLERIDKATKVLDDAVNRTPTEIQKATTHLRDVINSELTGIKDIQLQRKDAVDKHFEHLDKVRAEDKREARDLVNIALSAEKDARAVALTNANNAITKAAESTDKRYEILDKVVGEIRIAMASMMPRKESEARHAAHEAAVSLLTSRVTAIEATKIGSQERIVEQRQATVGINASLMLALGVIGAILTVVVIGVMIYTATVKGGAS